MADSPASCWDYRCEETETRPLARSVLYTANKSDRSLTEGTDDSCTTLTNRRRTIHLPGESTEATQ